MGGFIPENGPVLVNLPDELSYRARLEHTTELMVMLQGYITAHPEHTEYYESVITHLNAINEGYATKLAEIQKGNLCKNQLN